MKYSKLVIILVTLLFLLSCQQGLTGLVSLEDYQDLLTYENQTISASETPDYYFEEADEPEPHETMGTSGGEGVFVIAANHNVNNCFTASTVPGAAAGDSFTLQNDVIAGAGDCVLLDLDDIVFDCAGYVILGTSSTSDDAIYVTKKNVTIKNCELTGFDLANNTGTAAKPVYDFSYGIVVGIVGRNVTVVNTTIYNIVPTTGYGGGGIRFNSQWGSLPAYLNLSNVTVYNSNNGIRIGTQTLAGPGGADFIEGPFWTNDCNFTNNTYFQYLGYNTDGNHHIANTTFIAGENERSLQIAGNQTVFVASGRRTENISIKDCTFTGGPLNTSDVFLAKVKNITIENTAFERNIIIVNSTNITITNNDFAAPSNTNLSLNAILLKTANNFTIARHPGPAFTSTGISKLFDFENVQSGTIRDNIFTDNGKIRVTESVAGTNNAILIRNNTFNNIKLQYQSAAGIYFDGTNSLITLNTLKNGETYSIEIVGNYVNATTNTVENVTGTAFKIRGDHNYIFNNTITNHTGTVFWIDGKNHLFANNDVTFILENMNVSLNYDPSTGPYSFVPEAGQAFLLLNTTNINITTNTVGVSNPSALRVGVDGIKSLNKTITRTGTVKPATTNNAYIYNNTLGAISISDFGLRISIFLRDSFNALILNNTITNSRHEGIVIDSGSTNNITGNNVSQATQNVNPYFSAAGIRLFRSTNNSLIDNEIFYFDSGVYCYNSTVESILGNDINFSSRHGIFLHRCFNATLISNTVFNATSGIKLLYTNFSSIDTNLVNRTKIGFDFNQAHNNTVSGVNVQEYGRIGLNLDLFSSGNVFNANVFGQNSDVDVLYDMFANHNTGAGNTYTTSRSENYANNNLI